MDLAFFLGSKIFFQHFFDPKFFLIQNFFGPKFFWAKKYLWSAHIRPEIFFRPKNFFNPTIFFELILKKNCRPKIFQNKNSDPNIFLINLKPNFFNLDPKFFLGPNFFWQKNLLADLTYFCTKNLFCPNM